MDEVDEIWLFGYELLVFVLAVAALLGVVLFVKSSSTIPPKKP